MKQFEDYGILANDTKSNQSRLDCFGTLILLDGWAMVTSGLFASPGNHGDLQINSKAAKKKQEKIEKRVIISSILKIITLYFSIH